MRSDPALGPDERADLLRLLVEQGWPADEPASTLTADPRPPEAWLSEVARVLAGHRTAGVDDRLSQVAPADRDWAWRHLAARGPLWSERDAIGCGVVDTGGRDSFVHATRSEVCLTDATSGARTALELPLPFVARVAARGGFIAIVLGPPGEQRWVVYEAASRRIAWQAPYVGTYLEVSPTEPAILDIAPSQGLTCRDADGLRWSHPFANAGQGWGCFTSDGERVLVQEVDQRVRLSYLDARTGERLPPEAWVPGDLLGLATETPDGDALLVLTTGGELHEFSASDLRPRRVVGGFGSALMGTMSGSADGSRYVLASRDADVVFDRGAGAVVARFSRPDIYWSMGFCGLTRDGRRLIRLDGSGVVVVDVEAGQPLSPASTDVALEVVGKTPLRHPFDDVALVLRAEGPEVDASRGAHAKDTRADADARASAASVPWLVRASDGEPLFALIDAPTDVEAWGWSADGHRLVLRASDGRLLCWHDGVRPGD
ncbi:MAG: hypothetical protein H6825_07090 [Planctomycetes bacterium]|nr:hypothetical protein [Planctomycetota bacterium]